MLFKSISDFTFTVLCPYAPFCMNVTIAQMDFDHVCLNILGSIIDLRFVIEIFKKLNNCIFTFILVFLSCFIANHYMDVFYHA